MNYKSGFYDKSLVSYRQVINRTPQNARAYALLALTYVAMGCPPDAMIYAKKSLQLESNQPIAQDILRCSGNVNKLELQSY